ncbi:hypothetical protein GGR32_000100 [Mesonia hippocampi]|uniref:Nicotinic acid mononucleotide adenyltransferase n=1 Tax=Mesonia hippocampi TaxID=1628250 RepID=A0A840EI37_9FLAO|nr:hypothetical protein [Mesonia hippocampi]MBB4117828.1 hypothetical protein [Mesonia hippocampi]
MKKILFLVISISIALTSCKNDDDNGTPIENNNSITKLLASYTYWFIEPTDLQNIADVDFVKNAITLSFQNEVIYAQNNLIGFDNTTMGNAVSTYTINQQGSEAYINVDNRKYRVYGLGSNALKLVDSYDTNIAFYMTGYNANDFNLDDATYSRIIHLFNEYQMWVKTEEVNPDNNNSVFKHYNYLRFAPTYSMFTSTDTQGKTYDQVDWQATDSKKGSFFMKEIKDEDVLNKPRHHEMRFLHLSDNGETTYTDTLEVYIINHNKIKFIDKKHIEHHFEGSVNTPF